VKITKIEFKHTINLAYDAETDRYTYENKDKNFSLILDEEKQNHKTIDNWLKTGLLYESDVSGLLCKLLKPNDIAVDVGANIGFHTFLMSALVEGTGRVYAYEPALESIRELEQNKVLNKALNVTINQKLLGERHGDKVDFHFSLQDSGTSYAIRTKDKPELGWERMMTYSLNDELKSHTNIKLIKLDVEGFEGNILRGATDLLVGNRVKYWVVEYAPHCLARNGDNLETLRSYMADFGLEMFVLDAQSGFPKLWPKGLYLFTRFIPNLLFAKKDELVRDWVMDDVSKFVSPPSMW